MGGGISYYIPQGYRRIKHIVMALPQEMTDRLSALQSSSSAISQA